jgi:Holliday junction resolvase RusA-like endonuclease
MMQIMFTVPGQPHGKGRPRFARRGNFVATYTDAKTASYEDQVRFYALQAMGSSEPLKTALEAFIYIRLLVPKSYPKKRVLACLNGSEWPCKKPDLDNVVKSFMDAMNGIVYGDDSQVVEIHTTKVYAETAGVDVLIKEKE